MFFDFQTFKHVFQGGCCFKTSGAIMRQDGWSTHKDLEESPGMEATRVHAYDVHTAARHWVPDGCRA